MLQSTDLRGLYAIIPTPATVAADNIGAESTVSLEETEHVVNALIADGVNGVMALGTTGECATLTNDEYDAFVTTFLGTVRGRVPTFVGTTALGSHEIARRMRFVRDHGADGALLGMPMWQPLTLDMAIEHYRAMSEAFPSLALMVYANARAFRFNFTDPEFWRRVVDAAPTVMAAKFSVAKALTAVQEAARGRVHFLPVDDEVGNFARIAPETTTACWATTASMGPQPSLAHIQAILQNDAARVESTGKDLAWANEPIADVVASPERFALFNIQIEKLRINAAGYCNAGPIRPPYAIVPDDIIAMSQECARRWRALCDNYCAQPLLSSEKH